MTLRLLPLSLRSTRGTQQSLDAAQEARAGGSGQILRIVTQSLRAPALAAHGNAAARQQEPPFPSAQMPSRWTSELLASGSSRRSTIAGAAHGCGASTPTPAPAPQKQDTTAKPASTAAATPPSTSSQSPATSTQSAVVAAAGNVTAGRQVFRKCQACHSLDPGKNLVGQSLAGSIHRCGNRPRRAPRKDERSRQEDEFLVLLRHSMRLGAYLEDQCCVAVCVLTALNSAANAGFALPGWLTASAFCRFDDGSPTMISPTMPIA